MPLMPAPNEIMGQFLMGQFLLIYESNYLYSGMIINTP